MEIAEHIPPKVEFETRYFEDRDATLEAMEFVGIPKDIIRIMPAGSKDVIEKLWEDWYAQRMQDAQNERFPYEWLKKIKEQYDAWKNDTPVPQLGTLIKTWKHATPRDKAAMEAINITTVEELAVANEQSIMRLGIGARTLKKKAEMYLRQEKIPEDMDVLDASAGLKELPAQAKTAEAAKEAPKAEVKK